MAGQSGTVYLVGAGPGDPKLLTLRGKECLERADVVLYDYLANPRCWTAPAWNRCNGRAGAWSVSGPSGHQSPVERARGGKIVVRLKGGDPFVFRRGGEEAEALQLSSVRDRARRDCGGRGAGLCGHPGYIGLWLRP
ncbi:MAG: SAM-dependent methyltransferase [Nitrospiraceae bacterium]